ncbi:MAG: hypothetical protein H6550_07300 [Chitinophagales bacterium]|nr:hypothetical protein [Chitinophagales bacterium]
MKRFTIVILSLLLLTACDEDNNDRSQQAVLNRMEDDYLKQIEQLGITDLYTETKWRLYCNHCDVPVKNCSGVEMKGLTYGMLDLKVFFLKYEDGVGKLAYTFLFHDSLQCSLADVQGNKIHGIGFEKNGTEPLFYISSGETEQISAHCDTMEDLSDCPTRMINPDQPVVRKFLEANRPKLNPWFHMEAVKRGFLD